MMRALLCVYHHLRVQRVRTMHGGGGVLNEDLRPAEAARVDEASHARGATSIVRARPSLTRKDSMPPKSPVKFRRHLRVGLEGLRDGLGVRRVNSMRAESVDVIALPPCQTAPLCV
jgi:hypothetical protein